MCDFHGSRTTFGLTLLPISLLTQACSQTQRLGALQEGTAQFILMTLQFLDEYNALVHELLFVGSSIRIILLNSLGVVPLGFL